MMEATEDREFEPRQSLRVTLHELIECAGTAGIFHRELGDLGVGGMFIDSHPVPFEQGEVLTLRFYLARSEPRLVVRAEVLYVQPRIGMGVRFLDLTADQQERIRRFIEGVDAAKRPPMRKSARVFVSVPVTLWVAANESTDFEDASIVSLSKYGACIETVRPLGVGTKVFLATRSGREFKGSIVWVGSAASGNPAQAGVQCRGLAQALGFHFP